MVSPKEASRLLADLRQGAKPASSKMLLLVYEELRGLASRSLRRQRTGHTLQTTALVHETYLRLADQKGARWRDRFHFFRVAAKTMRSVLVDYARREHALKRGGGMDHRPLEESDGLVAERGIDLVALDEALNKLGSIDAEKGRLVELHFFGGLTLEETAQVLSISLSTAKRDWKFARAWLQRELSKGVEP